jgi:hypothetical protein
LNSKRERKRERERKKEREREKVVLDLLNSERDRERI